MKKWQLSFLCLRLNMFSYLLLFCLFVLFTAIPAACGSSQARGSIGATAASRSHSNAGSEPCLRPTPQLTATLDPRPTEQSQGSNPQPHGSQSDLFPLHHERNSQKWILNQEINTSRAKMPQPTRKSFIYLLNVLIFLLPA